MSAPSFSVIFLRASRVALIALLLAGGLKAADTEMPSIGVDFDDDASSLLVNAQWKEDGVERKESFILGKDMHLMFIRNGNSWEKQDQGFKSKNWEAFMYPDGTGFLLMEREYNGEEFENIGLTYYVYYPNRRTGSLRPANGSPYWSPDSKQLALVDDHKDGTYGVVIYDTAAGNVLISRNRLDEDAFKGLTDGFARARICDDSVPCETIPGKHKKKISKKSY
jgi:hypothetical protein